MSNKRIILLLLEMDIEPQLKNIQFYICISLQATCQQNKEIKPCQQIIEISAVLIQLKGEPKIIDRFHTLVRPKCNPKLSQFCIGITGIKSVDVKNANQIQGCLSDFKKWMDKFKEMNPSNSAFLAWGSWGLQKLLPNQLKIKKINYPQYINSFTDLKRIYNYTISEGNVPIHEAVKQMKIQINEKDKTKGQFKAQGVAQIALKLFRDKKFKPDRKFISILHSIPEVNITKDLQYLLVLDFEATCEENIKLKPCQQIIEFPVMIIDLKERKIIDQFHEYITPSHNPILSKFCTQLTGITQQMVENKPKLEQVLARLDKWINDKKFLHSKNFTFVTCGDWDLATCLRHEAKAKNIEIPQYLKGYINIKKVYANIVNPESSRGMMSMLAGLHVQHEGRHHSGIDDVKNICKVCLALIDQKGLQFTRKFISQVK